MPAGEAACLVNQLLEFQEVLPHADLDISRQVEILCIAQLQRLLVRLLFR